MMTAPLSEAAQNEVARIVAHAVRKAHPGVEGELETHLLIAYALRDYARYAAAVDRFGPDHEITRAYLDLATSLARPIGDETSRLAMIAIENQAIVD
jgi:hypothetical protein